MGLSVANILLQVTGDSSQAQKELADVARDLALFAREEAEAEAYVDTTEAKVELDELKASLAEFDGKEVSAEVNVKIAKAQTDIAVLQAELDKVDGENVTVDVDVKRGIVEKIGALSRSIEGLGEDTEEVSAGGLRAFVSSIGEAFSGASIFGVSLAKIVTIGPIVVAAVVAIVGQLAALVATTANAAAGVGALGIAFGAALVPGILLGIGAIKRFKEDSETAGTASYALKGNVEDLVNAFGHATSGGADALFQGISDGIRDIYPLVKELRPAFTALGEAGGNAFRLLGEEFSSPEWRRFFIFTTESLTKLTPLFAETFSDLAAILRNIATAAMPFLIKAFEAFDELLEGFADKTSNIKEVRGVIGGMVQSLSALGDLLGGLTDLAVAFVEAFAPFGDGIAKSLGEGAHHLAEWLRSSEGLDKIKQFFERTGPLASELGNLLLNISVALIQLAELVAPPLTTVLHLFNKVFDGINAGLSYLNDHFGQIGKVLLSVIAPISLIAGAFAPIKGAAVDAFKAVKGAAEDAVNFISKPVQFVIGFASDIASKARDIWGNVKDAITDAIKFVINFASDIAARARAIWGAVKGVINDVIRFAFSLPDDMGGRARSVWGTVKGVVSDVINFIFSLPDDIAGRARDLWSTVKGIISDAVSFVLSLPGGLVAAAKNLWNEVKDAVSSGIDLVIHLVPDVSSLPGKVAGFLGFANGVEDLIRDTFAMVGERGPELAFLPQGTDIYTAGETRNILKALGSGAAAPAAAAGRTADPPGQTSTAPVTNNVNVSVVSPGTGPPDPTIAAAQWDALMRSRGILASP